MEMYFPFPYILSVAYLSASAKYNVPLIRSTASKFLCGFCSTPGISQINCCTGFVLKKAFVFKSYTWLNEKDLALCFLPGYLGSTNCLLYVWRRLRAQGMGQNCRVSPASTSTWPVSMENTDPPLRPGQREAFSSNNTSHVHVDISPWFQPKEKYMHSQSSWFILLLDTHFRRGIMP